MRRESAKGGVLTLIRRIVNKHVYPVWNQMYLDIGDGPRDTVFLAGTERSGTTWVAESINHERDHRFMFEPFWAHKVPESSQITPQQYIRPSDRSPEKVAAAEQILSGNVRNAWIDQFHRKFIARKRLVKDVRSNLYLKWLSEIAPGMPIILLIRHPCAVAKSQIERKHGFPSSAETFLSQPELLEDHLEPFAADMRQDLSPFEDRVFRWCVQNYVPLRQFRHDEIHVVFYESLCTEPETEYRAIMEFLDLPFDRAMLRAVSRPSPMSQSGSAVNTGADLVNSWRKSVSDADASAAKAILRLFGLDTLYGGSALPDRRDLAKVMRQ